MTTMTSAYANKVIRKLREEKEYWLSRKKDGYVYVASVDEEPVIPEYDYRTVADNIAKIDENIIRIKHAINVVNVANKVTVGDDMMTIDAVLVKMAQLNKRKEILDKMRKMQPKSRADTGMFSYRKAVPEYQYINFDMAVIEKDYAKVDGDIAQMQIALDKFNQTFEFEVDLDFNV